MARTRVFIAVPLTPDIRREVAELQTELSRSSVEVKWTEPENLHVTLIFLGEVNDEELPRICQIVSKSVQDMPPFRMVVQSTGCFPNPRRPRVIWVGIGQGAQDIRQIHDVLEPPFFDLGFRTEDRKYTPHITLGRVRGSGPTDNLANTLSKRSGWIGGEMTVSEIHIMGSELTPQGPAYTVLGRAKLEP